MRGTTKDTKEREVEKAEMWGRRERVGVRRACEVAGWDLEVSSII